MYGKDPTGNLPGLLLYNKRSENSEREVETNSKGNDGEFAVIMDTKSMGK